MGLLAIAVVILFSRSRPKPTEPSFRLADFAQRLSSQQKQATLNDFVPFPTRPIPGLRVVSFKAEAVDSFAPRGYQGRIPANPEELLLWLKAFRFKQIEGLESNVVEPVNGFYQIDQPYLEALSVTSPMVGKVARRHTVVVPVYQVGEDRKSGYGLMLLPSFFTYAPGGEPPPREQIVGPARVYPVENDSISLEVLKLADGKVLVCLLSYATVPLPVN